MAARTFCVARRIIYYLSSKVNKLDTVNVMAMPGEEKQVAGKQDK